MTVENQLPIQHFIANGNTTIFALNFQVEGKDNIDVYLNDELIKMDYYNYDNALNAIVFNVAPKQDAQVTLKRDTVVDRSIQYATYNNTFRPETLNTDLDRIIRILQEQGYTDSKISYDLAQEIYKRSQQNTELKKQIDSNTLSLADINLIQNQEKIERINADKEVALSARDYTNFMLKANNSSNIFEGIADNIVITQSGDTQRQINQKTVTTVASIADLIAIKNPKDGQVIHVDSYYTGLEKGGGTFTYNNSKKEINDKGNIINGWVRSISETQTPEMFGAKTGSENDQETFTAIPKNALLTLGSEYTVPVYRSQVRKVIGNNTKIYLDSVNGDTTVALQIPSDSNISDVNFINNPKQSKSWSYGVIGSNSILNNVGFYNFDDNVSPKNSWGIYFENKDNIVLNSPKFGGNGVADIAIVDNVQNITIINAKNTVDSEGVSLDIEPNEEGNIKNINIIGGKYKAIHVLENSFLSQGIRGLTITGAHVGLLELRGGQTKLINSKVDRIKGNWANSLDYSGQQNEYFGNLEVDNVNLSKNLITDQYLNSLSLNDTNSYWSIYAPQSVRIKRINDENGYYTSLNYDQTSHQQISSRNYISIPKDYNTICVALGYQILNGTDGVSLFEIANLTFYDSSNNIVKVPVSIKGGRTLAKKYDWSNEISIFDIPESAVKFKVSLKSNKPKSTLNIRKVGVYALKITDNKGNFNEIISGYGFPRNNDYYQQNTLPSELDYGTDGTQVETSDGSVYIYEKFGNTYKLKLTKKLKNYFQTPKVNNSIPATSISESEYQINGAKVGQNILISATFPLNKDIKIWGEVVADNSVKLYQQNSSTTAFNNNGLFNITLE